MIEFLEKMIFPYPASVLLFLIGAINACWILYLLLFKRNFKQKIYKAYYLFAFWVLAWVWSNAYAESGLLVAFGTDGLIYTFLTTSISSTFAITTFYYISALMKSRGNKISLFSKLFIGFMIGQNLVFNLMPGVAIEKATIFENSFELIQSPYYSLFYIFITTAIILSFANIIAALQKSKKQNQSIERRRFLNICIGISLMYSTAIIFHMFIPYVFRNYSYGWVPPAFSLLDVLIVGYGILTQRFRSLKLFLWSSLKFIFSFSLSLAIAFGFFKIIQFFIRNEEIYAVALSALIFTLVFLKIYNLFHLNKFGQITTIEQFQSALAELKQRNRIYNSLEEFEIELSEIFCNEFSIRSAEIILLDKEKKKTYKKLINFCENRQSSILVTKEIQLSKNSENQQFSFGKELTSLGEICLLLYSPNKNLIAFFVLGKKPFNNFYTKEEIEAVEQLASFLSLNLASILYNSELKQEIESKTQNLQHQNKQIKKQNHKISIQNKEISKLLGEKTKLLAQQSDFLALTAHELRTPLAILMLQVDQLLILHHHQDDIKEEGEAMKKTLHRLKDLMDKLFEVFQYDLEKINISLESTNIFEFIERIYEDFKPLMKEKNLNFVLENKLKRNLIASIDPVYMRQVMQNLILNAIKFTPLRGYIKLIAKESRKSFILLVADSGEGVPESTKEEIFRKFKSNHTMQSPGLGLGLYICKKIIEQHQGKIWVEDNLERGAIFGIEMKKTHIKEEIKQRVHRL